jgi:hypothetical protein
MACADSLALKPNREAQLAMSGVRTSQDRARVAAERRRRERREARHNGQSERPRREAGRVPRARTEGPSGRLRVAGGRCSSSSATGPSNRLKTRSSCRDAARVGNRLARASQTVRV